MEFLGIGPFEVLLILFLALLIFGPNDFVKTGRNLGRWIYQLKNSEIWRTLTQTGAQLRELPKQIVQEAELEELNKLFPGQGEIGQIGSPDGTEQAPIAPQNQSPANQKLAAWSGETHSAPAPQSPPAPANSGYLSSWSQPQPKSGGLGHSKPSPENPQPAENAGDPT